MCYLLLFGFNLSAAPTFVDEHTAIQPNGYQFQLSKTKNNSPYVREIHSGHTVIFDKRRDQWVYAILDKKSRLASSPFVVGVDKPTSIPDHLFSNVIYETEATVKQLAITQQLDSVGGSIGGKITDPAGNGLSARITLYKKDGSNWSYINTAYSAGNGIYSQGV